MSQFLLISLCVYVVAGCEQLATAQVEDFHLGQLDVPSSLSPFKPQCQMGGHMPVSLNLPTGKSEVMGWGDQECVQTRKALGKHSHLSFCPPKAVLSSCLSSG